MEHDPNDRTSRPTPDHRRQPSGRRPDTFTNSVIVAVIAVIALGGALVWTFTDGPNVAGTETGTTGTSTTQQAPPDPAQQPPTIPQGTGQAPQEKTLPR